MRVQSRTRSAAGVFSPVQTVSPPGYDAHWPAVGIDANGRALIVWQGHDGTFFRIRARRRSAGGTFGSIRTLASSVEDGTGPVVAVDPDGNAVLAWGANTGTRWQVYSAPATLP